MLGFGARDLGRIALLPMFFVAPDYPRWITVGVPVSVPIGLLTGNVWILGAACSVWAVFTLRVLHRRKRRAPDPVVWFWQFAMVVLVTTTAMCWLTSVAELTVGVLFVVGFVLTVMTGMLYKIVPFLVFLHLQRACLSRPERFGELPTMHSVIPVGRARWQFFIHVVAVASCVAATLFPVLGAWAAVLLAADCAWLGVSVRRGWTCYRRKLEELDTLAVVRPPTVASAG